LGRPYTKHPNFSEAATEAVKDTASGATGAAAAGAKGVVTTAGQRELHCYQHLSLQF